MRNVYTIRRRLSSAFLLVAKKHCLWRTGRNNAPVARLRDSASESVNGLVELKEQVSHRGAPVSPSRQVEKRHNTARKLTNPTPGCDPASAGSSVPVTLGCSVGPSWSNWRRQWVA